MTGKNLSVPADSREASLKLVKKQFSQISSNADNSANQKRSKMKACTYIDINCLLFFQWVVFFLTCELTY
ncbi:hypothetical protein BW687_006310 [Pseudomonas graminis]|uniref:hypothetical protein n=1 Tax=Pseudomonas graminis TaxID=158627 RepID=UPI00234B7782|nr:hypothetical protein [Pseudomonas graminis]MDC6379793.1 hypothetical protein [Pseudomonas graminis]